jgi:hypothetical protein
MTLAAAGCVVGMALAGTITLQRQGGPLGDPDSSTRMIADNTWALAWTGVAATAGWILGVLLGWRIEPRNRPPSVPASWALRAVSIGLAVVGVLTLLALPSAEDVRLSDTHVAYDISTLTWIVVIGATIGIATLLLLARRATLGRSLVVAGIVLAALAVIVGAVRVGALPSPDRAWLERWLATRQAPLGAAPNLIDPASGPCTPRSPDPFPGEDRSFSSDMPHVYYWLDPWAPRWLPEGFGLALDRSWPWPRPHGVWTDARCREITLFTYGRRGEIAALEEVPPDVASWRRTSPSWCTADSACLEYRVVATIRGSDDKTLLVLRTVGVSRTDSDRIARSTPTDRVPYV